MANWIPVNNRLGVQAATETSTTQKMALGSIVSFYDDTTSGFGTGEFIYLVGVANTIVGSAVTWNFITYQTALLPATANTGDPVGASMSANVATQFGWYQIEGVATFTKSAACAITTLTGVPVYVAATAGAFNISATTGMQIQNAQTANTASVASATVTMTVVIDRPCVQGVAA